MLENRKLLLLPHCLIHSLNLLHELGQMVTGLEGSSKALGGKGEQAEQSNLVFWLERWNMFLYRALGACATYLSPSTTNP